MFQYENSGVAETSIWPTHFTLATPIQEGQMNRSGNPLSSGSGRPLIS